MLLALFRQVCQLVKRNANQNAVDDRGQVCDSVIQSYLFTHLLAPVVVQV